MKKALCCVGTASLLTLMMAGKSYADSHTELPPTANPETSSKATTDTRLVLSATTIVGVLPDDLRNAIAAELGVEVVWAGPSTTGRGTLTIRVEGRLATVSFQANGSPEITRKVELPKKPRDVQDTLTLLLGNLVRNEAAEFLATLRPKATLKVSAEVTVTTPAPAMTPPPPPEPSPPITTTVTPNLDFRETRTREDCSGDAVAAGLDVAPGLGSYQHHIRRLGLGLFGTSSRGVRGFDFGSLAALTQGDMCGVQLGGVVATTSGLARGVTFGGAVVVHERLEGVAISGTTTITRNSADGVSIGGIWASVGGKVDGALVGGAVAIALGHTRGVSIGGLFATSRGLTGFMTAGIFAHNQRVEGVVVAPINIADTFDGLQLGGFNLARGEMTGAQLGVANISTGVVKGLQLGLFNYAPDADAAIGLVTILTRGRTQLSITATETGFGMLELEHGGRVVHNVYGIGFRTGTSGTRAAVSLGIGARLIGNRHVTLDLDGVATWMPRNTTHLTLVSQLRLIAGIRLGSVFTLLAGPTYSVMTTNDPEESAQTSLGVTQLTTDSRAYPGGMIGLRVF